MTPKPTKRLANLPGITDKRIDALLTLLAENATIVISGAQVAQEIGVTRQQVWRWIEKLRELGVRVKGHTATGYHIERVPDILAPQLLGHRLTGTRFARRRGGAGRGADGGARAGGTQMDLGEIRRDFLQRVGAAADFAVACAAADPGGGTGGARCSRRRIGVGAGHSLA